MTAWTVTYADRTELIEAPTYPAALDIARAPYCRGRRPYPTRRAALAASTGPALPCGDHWHATERET